MRLSVLTIKYAMSIGVIPSDAGSLIASHQSYCPYLWTVGKSSDSCESMYACRQAAADTDELPTLSPAAAPADDGCCSAGSLALHPSGGTYRKWEPWRGDGRSRCCSSIARLFILYYLISLPYICPCTHARFLC